MAADLELRLADGSSARIVGRGSTLELRLERARDLRQLGGRVVLLALAPRLAALGLTIRVISRGRTLLVAGKDATPGVVGRLVLGSPAAALRPTRTVRRRR